MNLYEQQIQKELKRWHDGLVKKAGVLERASNGIQKKTQQLMPQKVQNTITKAIETMVETMLNGSGILSVKEDTAGLSLAESDYLVLHMFRSYQKTATVQGAGFGLGGIILGMADLPVLMGIKIKFLFDTAKLYGYDPEWPDERLYLLHVFQLAFSGKACGLEVFQKLEHWEQQEHLVVDWEQFQIEYRNYLDLAKMLQLLPVVGSVVGGTANYKLMEQLCKTAMNCYRLRRLGQTFSKIEVVPALPGSRMRES